MIDTATSHFDGQSGAVNSVIRVSIGTYIGGGISGFDILHSWEFAVTNRKANFKRPRVPTPDNAVPTAVTGPPSLVFEADGFYRVVEANDYPPNILITNGDAVLIEANVDFDFLGVFLLEKVDFTGPVEGAVQFSFSGETTGDYEIDGETTGVFAPNTLMGAVLDTQTTQVL